MPIAVAQSLIPTTSQAPLDARTVVAALVIPCIPPPRPVPHPVAVCLQQSLAVGQLVGGVGPVPVRGLRIQVQSVGAVYTVHGLYGFLDECRR